MGLLDKPKKALTFLVVGEDASADDQPFPLWASVLGAAVLVGSLLWTGISWVGTDRGGRDDVRTAIPQVTTTLEIPEAPVTTDTPATQAPATVPESPTTTEGPETPTSPSTGQSNTTVNLLFPDGSPISVPTDAVSNAHVVAVAAFTGDFGLAALTPEFTTPSIGTSFPTAAVSGEAVVMSSRIGMWVLEVPVAAEPGSTPVPVTVELVAVGSNWLVSSIR